jgi:hypothetical protein
VRLEVRAEAFNAINHTNFIAPATGTGIPGISTSGISLSRSSANFGQITSAGDPRIWQIRDEVVFLSDAVFSRLILVQKSVDHLCHERVREAWKRLPRNSFTDCRPANTLGKKPPEFR